MTASERERTGAYGLVAGRVSVLGGLLGLVGLAWTWLLSAIDLVGESGWLRIPGILLLPLGVVVAVVLGTIGILGGGRARSRGLMGLALAGAGVAGTMVLQLVYGG